MAQRKEVESQERLDQLQQSRDELVSRVTSLEESGELMSSELASVQADLATAQSLVNTHQLTAEKVRVQVSCVLNIQSQISKRGPTLTDSPHTFLAIVTAYMLLGY